MLCFKMNSTEPRDLHNFNLKKKKYSVQIAPLNSIFIEQKNHLYQCTQYVPICKHVICIKFICESVCEYQLVCTFYIQFE